MFRLAKAANDSRPLNIGNSELHATGYIKYLGVYFDSKLSLHYCCDITKSKALNCRRLRRYPMYGDSTMSYLNRLLLIKTVIRPTMEYDMSAWADTTYTRKLMLRRTFSRNAKSILYLPWSFSSVELYKLLKIPALESRINDTSPNMINQLILNNILNHFTIK